MALPTLEGDIKLRDESAPTFDSVIRNAERANRALKGAQTEFAQFDQVLAQLNVRTDQAGGFFDMLSGRNLGVGDVLTRIAAAGDVGGRTYEQMSEQLRQYVTVTQSATQATTTLAQRLEGAGPEKGQGFDRMGDQVKKITQELDTLEKRTDQFYRKVEQGAPQGGIVKSVKDIAPGASFETPFGNIGDIANKTQGILTIAGSIATVVSGMQNLRSAIPERELGSFLQKMVIGIPAAGYGIYRLISGLTGIAQGLSTIGVSVPEKALDVFFKHMGGTVPKSAQDLIKVSLGFKNISDAIPETKVGGFLQTLTSGIPGASIGLLKVAGALGAVVTAALYVNDQMDQFLAFIRESEVRAANAGWLSVRLNTDTLEQDLDDIQALLGNRLTEEELTTILLKVDHTSALTNLEEFKRLAATVQAFADEFGVPWQEALSQVVEAINRADGAFLVQMGIINNADSAFNDYATELGKTTPQLTKLERQQALVNAVVLENAGILEEVASNSKIALGANQRFTAQLSDMKTALDDFISAFAENRIGGILNWFADDGTLGPFMRDFEKWMSDQASNERIRAQLSDFAESAFNRLLDERNRIAGQITDLSAEIPKASAAGDQERVNWLRNNIEQLENRMQIIDASIQVAREDVFAGRPITPLPAPIDNQALTEKFAPQEIEIRAQYEDRLAQAREQLTAATQRLVEAEQARQQTIDADPISDVLIAQYEAQIQQKQAELRQLDQQIAEVRDSLVAPPTIAIDTSAEERKLHALTQQIEIINGEIARVDQRVVVLNNASNFVRQIEALTARIGELRQGEGNEKEIEGLLEQRAQMLQSFLTLAEQLETQGITIAAPDMPIEETTAEINRQAQAAYTALDRYRERLGELDTQIAQIREKIDNTPPAQVDTEAVRALQAQLSTLTQLRAQVQQEIDSTATLLAQQGNAPEVAAAEAAEKQARLAQQAAQAKIDLLAAEQEYVLSLNTLQQAAASGNIGMWEQAEQAVKDGQQRLHQAYANFFAANASDAQSLIETQKRLADYLGQDFLADIESGKIPTLEIFNVDDVSDQALAALDAAQKAVEGNPVEIATEVDGESVNATADAMIKQAQESVNKSRITLVAALQSGDADAIQEARSNRDAAAAQAERVVAAISLAQALDNLTKVRERGIVAEIIEAEKSVEVAQATYDEAAATANATGIKAAGATMRREMATAVLGEAASLELMRRATEQSNQAQQEQDLIMDNVARRAGILVDTVSGLPLAFNAAELNARQLDQALVDLETQMHNIEASAISAGFSIANRLIPVMGLAGSLQQAGQWAQQARGISDTFNQINQNRLAQGQNPLGTEVLTSSMDALRQSWNAMATDSIAAMRKVESGVKGGSDAMEQAIKRMDSALDNMIQGVLQDSTKGLIKIDEILPREDVVDEKARRMADVAVKGFKSPWFDGLRDLFPEEVLSQGEGKVKQHAARMVRDHQDGLTTIFFDTEMAAQKVLEQIQAKQNLDQFVEGIRERVKELGADVDDLDIMEALGIDVTDQRVAGAASAAQRTMSEIVPSYEEIIQQLTQLGEAESPIIEHLTPSEAGVTQLKEAGTNAASSMGEEAVAQASEGSYGTRMMDMILNQIAVKEESIRAKGKDIADWLGGTLVERFRTTVPGELLDALVKDLIPLMIEAMAKEKERGATP